MASGEHLFLELPAEAGNIAVIRAAVATRAGELGLEQNAIDDLKTIVTEACANAVLHAYPDGAHEGPIEVEMGPAGSAVKVTVRDRGVGIQPTSAPPKPQSLRLGMQLIGAIASCFEIRSCRDRGTELVIELEPS
jgi:serine/threonine-protein kinase RsbW